MPFSGGVFSRIRRWVGEANISATEFDQDGDDVATALSNCILRDGTGAPTVDIPWGNKKITSLAAGVSSTDAVNLLQATNLVPAVNKLRNSSFAINIGAVAGTVTLAAGAYGHDGWKAGNGGCVYTFTTTGLYTTISVASGTLLQVIEGTWIDTGVHTLSQSGTAQARIYQGAAVGSYASCPFTTASLTANTDTTVEFSAGTILKPQLQAGTSATPYAGRLHAQEVELNARYRQQITFAATFWMGAAGTYNIPFTFPPMRAKAQASGMVASAWTGLISCNSSSPSALSVSNSAGKIAFPALPSGVPTQGGFSAITVTIDCQL